MCLPRTYFAIPRGALVAAVSAIFAMTLVSGCRKSDSESPDRGKMGASRRAYSGAPPVIPHPRQSGRCIHCHDLTAREIPTLGIAPANPHQATAGMSSDARCVQCHLFRQGQDEFRPSEFIGLTAAPSGAPHNRATPGAPPTVPHALFMREACTACHSAAVADEKRRCMHTDRVRCVQCHVAAVADQ